MSGNMKTRTITGIILLAALAASLALGGWVFGVSCTIAIGLALYEMIRALKKRGHQIVQWPIWAATVLSIPGILLFGSRLLLPLIMLTCIIVTIYVLFHGDPRLEDILMSLMPLFAVTMPGMSLLAQNAAQERWEQLLLLSTSFLVPVLGDTAAYFIGSRFGKKKFSPRISPNKTVEGAAASLLGSELTACMVWVVVRWITGAPQAYPPFWHLAALGLVCGVAGQTGDLFASLVKRYCGIKDYGDIFPGHGGMMDRFDSILMASMFVYLYQLIMVW